MGKKFKTSILYIWTDNVIATMLEQNLNEVISSCSVDTFKKLKKKLSNTSAEEHPVILLSLDKVRISLYNICIAINKINPDSEILLLDNSNAFFPLETKGVSSDFDKEIIKTKEKFLHKIHTFNFSHKKGYADFCKYVYHLSPTDNNSNYAESRRLPSASLSLSQKQKDKTNELLQRIEPQFSNKFTGSIHRNLVDLEVNYVEMLTKDKTGKNALDAFKDTVENNDLQNTFLVLGDRACGKTTFLSYYIMQRNLKFSKNMIFTFRVDFLKYIFISDARSMLCELSKYLFDYSNKNNLLEHHFNNYEEFLDSQNYCRNYLYKNIKYPDDLNLPQSCKTYVKNIFRSSDDAVKRLYSHLEPEGNADPIEWKHSIIINMPVNIITKIVAYFVDKSLVDRNFFIAESILKQSKTTYSKQLQKFTDKHGDINDENFISSIKSFIEALATNNSVIIIIDNADRAIYPLTELDIFRTAWAFFENICITPKIIFAMRTSTFYRHKERHYNPSHGADIRTFDTLPKIEIVRPTFSVVAKKRLISLKEYFKKNNLTTEATIVQYYLLELFKTDNFYFFENLFHGDLRLNLNLFAFSVASPHMATSSVYKSAEKLLRNKNADFDTYVHKHKLLSSLLLGRWNYFKQERSFGILNVYNANFNRKNELWRNTLAIPRAIAIINNNPDGILYSEFCNYFINLLGYSQEDLSQALRLINEYGLLEPTEEYFHNYNNQDIYKLSPCGSNYVNYIMFSLEYLQAIYWDTPIPNITYYEKFCINMTVENLHGFLQSFKNFIRFEQIQEQNSTSQEGKDLILSLHKDNTLLDNIDSQAFRQLNNIYFTMKNK